MPSLTPFASLVKPENDIRPCGAGAGMELERVGRDQEAGDAAPGPRMRMGEESCLRAPGRAEPFVDLSSSRRS